MFFLAKKGGSPVNLMQVVSGKGVAVTDGEEKNADRPSGSL
jgi:hypothetical protein